MKASTETTSHPPKTSETENDIAKAAPVELNSLLHQRLEDLLNLQLELKRAHSNARAQLFIGLDELLDKIAEDVESYVEMAADRMMKREGIAKATARAPAPLSKLEEYSVTAVDSAAHVEAVAKALSAFRREARVSVDEANALDDADAADICTEIWRAADKWLWFVKALSERKLPVRPTLEQSMALSIQSSQRDWGIND